MTVANLTRVTLHGRGDGEEFQVSINVGGATPEGFSDLSAAADDMVTSMTGDPAWATARSLIAPDQFWDKVIMAFYAETGGPAEFSAVSVIPTASGQGTGSDVLPLQAAIVATLYSTQAGARGRGRCYWPLSGHPLAVGHLVDATVTDSIGELQKEFMRAAEGALAAHGGGVANTVVYSPTAGTAAQVNRVSVDNRPDTQRRRAESLIPTHTYSDAYTG